MQASRRKHRSGGVLAGGGWWVSPPLRSLKPMVLAFAFLCETTAYAHSEDNIRPVPENPRSAATIIVFSDGSSNYADELKNFSKVISVGSRPIVINGESLIAGKDSSLTRDSTLVYFGKSSHIIPDRAKLPTQLVAMIEKMPDYESLKGSEVLNGENTTGIGCYGDVREEEIGGFRQYTLFATFDLRNSLRYCRGASYAALLGLGWDFCDSHSCDSMVIGGN